MSELNMDTLVITCTMPHGSEGVDNDPANPLSRSLNRVVEEGKPIKRLSHCYFSPSNRKSMIAYLFRWLGIFKKKSLTNDVLRWLGVFVLGKRIMFFPGLGTSTTFIQGYQGKKLMWNESFSVDHFSLEKDFKRWHITSHKSQSQLGSPNTLPLGEGRYLWFGMSIADYSVLREVKRKTSVIVKTPPSDSRRRTDIIVKARENALFPIIKMNDEVRINTKKGFAHFAFIVGPHGFPSYEGKDLGFPEGSPYLATPFQDKQVRLPIRIHRISLSSELDIQITSAWLPGGLKVPLTITSQTKKIN